MYSTREAASATSFGTAPSSDPRKSGVRSEPCFSNRALHRPEKEVPAVGKKLRPVMTNSPCQWIDHRNLLGGPTIFRHAHDAPL